MKRRGNRRYYQHHEVLLIRKIRELLYDQGFTISGARNQLVDGRANGDASPPVPLVGNGSAALSPEHDLRALLTEVLEILKGNAPRL